MTYRIVITTEYAGPSPAIAEDKAQTVANYANLIVGKTKARIEWVPDEEQGASA